MFIFINSFKRVLFMEINLGTCLNMTFAYIKTLENVHKGLTPCSCIMCLRKESMLCVCGCDNYCLLRGWISTCPLCTLRVSDQTANWYSIKQL